MEANRETSQPADRRAAWVMGCVAASVVAFYLVRGMPWSHPDEFAWIGAGMDLARTGQLTNHALDGWLAGFGTDRFYIQPPFAAYSLAGWTRVCGHSAAGYVAFTWLWYLAGGFGLARVLGRFGLPWGMRLLVIIIYLNLLITKGFRPEAEALGLVFLGLGWLETGAPFWRRTVALLLLGFSVLTYPIAVALAVPFGAALLWLHLPAGTTASAGWRLLARAWSLPTLLAVTVVVAAFLAMVDFEPGKFLAVLNAHRLLRAEPGNTLVNYLRFVTRYQEALFTLPSNLLLAAAAGYVAVRWRQTEVRVRLWVAAAAVTGVSSIYLYLVRAPDMIALAAFASACMIASEPRFRPHRWKIVLVLGVFYTWTIALWIVDATGARLPDPAVLRRVREEALRSGKPLVVDSSTARYVFDYDLPAGTRHGEYIAPWDDQFRYRMLESMKHDYWVVTPGQVVGHDVALPPGVEMRFVTVGHHEFKSAPLTPDEPVVLRPED